MLRGHCGMTWGKGTSSRGCCVAWAAVWLVASQVKLLRHPHNAGTKSTLLSLIPL